MKKLIFVLMAFVAMSNVSFAQKPVKEPKGKPGMEKVQKAEPNAQPKAEAAQPKLKKDGTPDMRYKENKAAAAKEEKPAGPMKKDGTPDMRHKANKDAAAAKPVKK